MLSSLNTAIVVHGPDTRIIYSNTRACELLGLSEDQLQGKEVTDDAWHFITEQGVVMTLDDYPVYRVISSRQRFENLVFGVIIPQQTEPTWLSIGGFPEFDLNGELTQVVVNFYDISELKKAEEKLKKSEELLRLSSELANVAAWEIDLVADSMTRSSNHDNLYGLNDVGQWHVNTFMDATHIDDREKYNLFINRSLAPGGPDQYKFDFRIHYPDQSIHWLNVIGVVIARDSKGVGIKLRGFITDINDRKQAEEKLKLVAHFDVLTNLPNRVLLAECLNHAMVQCQRRNQSLAVAYLDLDGFKAVNDTYGHDLGDKLLVALSKRIKEALREGDTLSRIGGDEFIAVMVDLEKLEDTGPVLKRLLKAAAEPVTVGDAVMQVSASIGVTLYPQDGSDADQLIRHADNAMYVAKQAGKNRYHLFDTVQSNAVNIRRQNIADVRSALERSEFVLHYQPKVNMHTSEVIGVEALIRWQHPDRGLVPPLEFLPAIEGHTISLELGEWVIGTALNQINQWRNIGIYLPISVNISAYQLQQDTFITRLEGLLAAHSDVNPHDLELEILETSALSDISQVSATMNACHELGVRFALDDFGTGYSSLTYLRRLPAHIIKIDQSFVRDMLEDADDLAIIEGVVGLAKAFHREVIAEGVETIEHGVALLKLGCELAQGYGIARPMPSGDIPEWVSNWKADDSWQAYKG